MIVIDAKNLILGRMGTFVAKKALLGEEIIIVNCKDAMISGRKEHVFASYKRNRDRGTWAKGPFYPRRSDLFLKRLIRGMLPHKSPRGIDALKRIRCYVGVPKDFEGKEMTKVPGADISKIPNMRYVTIGEICKHLGGKQ